LPFHDWRDRLHGEEVDHDPGEGTKFGLWCGLVRGESFRAGCTAVPGNVLEGESYAGKIAVENPVQGSRLVTVPEIRSARA